MDNIVSIPPGQHSVHTTLDNMLSIPPGHHAVYTPPFSVVGYPGQHSVHTPPQYVLVIRAICTHTLDNIVSIPMYKVSTWF